MENEDNMRAINYHQLEELQPREVPKALCFSKVTPVPLVPDVSLVFDNNSKYPIQHCSPLLNRVSASSSTYQENDENEPRTNKPTPIAPLPNESYAAWRARAMNSQSEETVNVYGSSLLKGSGSKLGFNVSAVNSPIGRKMKEPPNKSIVQENDSQQNYHAVAPRAALGHLASHTHNSQPPLQKTLSVRTFSSRGQSGEYDENIPLQYAQGRHHHSLPKAVMFGKSVEQSISPLYNRQTIKRYPTPKDLESCSVDTPILTSDEQINNSVNPFCLRQTDDMHSPNSGASSLEGSAASCESSRDNSVDKKRDSFRDIYRIVQLQNEQIKSLQSQVERLLKKNISESRKNNASPKPERKSDITHCVEEGTQTYDLEDNMVTVGVMTSFVDSSKDSHSPENNKHKNSTTHCSKCSGCNGGLVQEENISDECSSGKEKIQEVFQNSRNYPNYSASPLNRQHDSPKTMSNMHKIIEEENESDDSLGSCGAAPREIDLGIQDSGNQNKRMSNSRSKTSANNQKAVRQGSNSEKCTSGELVNPSQVNKNEERASNSPVVLVNEIYNGKRGNHARRASQPRDLRNDKCCSRHDEEMTMTLNGVDLQTVTDPHISPEPSVHVEIQDYHEFSEEEQNSSNDEGSYSSGNESMSSSEHRGQLEIVEEPQNEARFDKNYSKNQEGVNGNAKVSWTFYDNVLGQVNKLLENHKEESYPYNAQEMNKQNPIRNPNQPATFELTPSDHITGGSETAFPAPVAQKMNAMPTLEAVREATLQHLRQLGINFPYEDKYSTPAPVMPSHNRYVTREAHFADNRKNVAYDQRGLPGKMPRERRPTETSLRMNALALKYLSNDQLAGLRHLDAQRGRVLPEPENFPEQQAPTMAQEVIGEVSSTDFTLYGMNGTNLSFTTLRYLQRYQLMPCTRASPVGIWRHQGEQQGNFTETATARGADFRNFTKPSDNHMDGPMQGENAGMSPHGQGTTPYFNAPMMPPASRMDGPMQGENAGVSPHGRGTTPYLNAPMKPSANRMYGPMQRENAGMISHGRGTTLNAPIKPSANRMDGPMQEENAGVNCHGRGTTPYLNAPSHTAREVFSSEGVITKRGSKRQDPQYTGSNKDSGGVHKGRIPDRDGNGMDNQIMKIKSKPSIDQVKNQKRHERGFDQNGCQSPDLQRREERGRPKECGVHRNAVQKTQLSNILDITALRQQPKLL